MSFLASFLAGIVGKLFESIRGFLSDRRRDQSNVTLGEERSGRRAAEEALKVQKEGGHAADRVSDDPAARQRVRDLTTRGPGPGDQGL